MEITEFKQNAIVSLGISGRLDAGTASALEQKFLSLLDGKENNFIIDLDQLQYISSAGLRILLMAAKRTAAVGGHIALCSLKGSIKEVFEISGFTAIFQIYATREEALGSF